MFISPRKGTNLNNILHLYYTFCKSVWLKTVVNVRQLHVSHETFATWTAVTFCIAVHCTCKLCLWAIWVAML